MAWVELHEGFTLTEMLPVLGTQNQADHLDMLNSSMPSLDLLQESVVGVTNNVESMQPRISTPPPLSDASSGAGDVPAAPLEEVATLRIESPEVAPEPSTKEILEELRLNNGAKFRPPFDMFFRHFNHLHPVINESSFYRCFDDLVFDESNFLSESDRQLFLVLANLIYAESTVLSCVCTDCTILVGWREFNYASETLDRLLPSMKPSLLAIQCLVIKTRYLLEVDNLGQAYDTISLTLRLAFQIGLHDQSSWKMKNSSLFDVVMWQRVFWCIFVLDQAISQSLGMPYLLRSNDHKVDRPRALDDRCLFPNRPLPQETPDSVSATYLGTLVGWTCLCKRAWDEAICLKATKKQDLLGIAALDAEMLNFLEQLQSPQTREQARNQSGLERTVLFQNRDHILFRQRVNAERLFIRREILMDTSLLQQAAGTIVEVANDSVECISASSKSAHKQPEDRYFMTVYLAGVLTPLSAVIVATNLSWAVRNRAIVTFQRANNALKELAKGFGLARRMLRRLQGVIDTVSTTLADPDIASSLAGLCDLDSFKAVQSNDISGRLDVISDNAECGEGANTRHAADIEATQPLNTFLVSHFPTPASGFEQWDTGEGFRIYADWLVTPW
ncbi:hypothetical protein LTR10_020895 [Elasticomyces elasticus]|nr:hypothetical protein LTR10_020895 [Elasticomyces elasticus]